MSLLRRLNIVILASLALLVSVTEAGAGLYGFHHYNPYSRDERILDLKEVPDEIENYRALMRQNLLMLIRYAKEHNPEFKVVAHEGQDLLTKSLWEYDREGYNRARMQAGAEDDSFLFHRNYRDLEPERYTDAYDYLHLLDGVAVNNIYCGKGRVSPVAEKHNLALIAIEQCADRDRLEEALVSAMIDKKVAYGFIDPADAFNNTDDHNGINDSAKNVYQVKDAQNILILTDDSRYKDKDELVGALLKTNYDIVIVKPLFADKLRFSNEDIQKLKFKRNGSKRLLLAEFNVSEAAPEQYFWHKDWQIGTPEFLVRKSFTQPDGVIVRYWDPEWQKIISRYFKDVVNEGFDGVFLTGIENYQYFEQQNPLE